MRGTAALQTRLRALEHRLQARTRTWTETDEAMKRDPVFMASQAGIVLDDWQADMVCSDSDRILLNCSRQVGKSSTAAIKAMHTVLYEEESLVLLVSPSLRQSGEIFRKCMSVYRALGRPVSARSESALQLELTNGSRVVSLPGNDATIRGLSAPKIIIIDEASRVVDQLYLSLRPMLAVSGGKLILLSTPWACRGFFYDSYLKREEWKYIQIDATQCPRITPEFLDEEKRTMGQFFFESEYMCRFMESAGSAFRAQDIERVVDKEITGWQF